MEQQTAQFSAEPTDQSQPAAAVRPALPIIVLSEDSTLLEAITNAAVEWCPVITSPSADRFIDQLVAAGSQLALIDAAASPPALAEFLADLRRQFPQLQILVAGPGTVQHQIAAQISDGTVFRFAHKPASAARLKLFVDAALRQRQAKITEQILSAPGNAGTSAATGAVAQKDRTGSGGRPMMLGAVVAALLATVAGGLLWYFRHSPASAPQADRSAKQQRSVPADSAAPRMPPAAVAPSVAAATGSAAVLAAQRAEEQEAIDRAAAERSERSERDRLIADNQARASAAEAEQLRRSAEIRSNQIRQYVQLAQQRIASAALLEPAGDSARNYVAAAVAAAPDDQDVRAVSIALGEALAGSFYKALNAGDGVAAGRWLKACRNYDLGDAALNQMSVQLDALIAAQVAQSAAALMTSGVPGDTSVSAEAPPAPAPALVPEATASAVVASKSVAAEPGIIAESKLHRLRFTAPSYPADALHHGQTGIVDMDFTVGIDGKVKDIKITAADPPGMFEEASESALSRNRYEPVEKNGQPAEQRAHIRMRFAL